MLNRTALLLVILALAVSLIGCTAAATETGIPPTTSTISPAIINIPPAQADELIKANKNNTNFVILDVRTPSEYTGGHIQNAVNLDYDSATFKDDAGHLDKNATYLVYCQTGVRSAAASKIMFELNFSAIYNMTGGITAWQAAGLPVVK